MARCFVPDSRNSGGRKAIADQMNNHLFTLLTIKPTINTRTPPHPHVKTRPVTTAPMSEVEEAFRRVSKVQRKGSGLDTKQPHTFSMSQQLSYNRARKQQTQMQEHYSNLKHMQRRIHAIGSYVERKKNPFDPITNPALFFRRTEELEDVDQAAAARMREKMMRPPHAASVFQRPATARISPKQRKRPLSSTTQVQPSVSEDFPITPYVPMDDPSPALSLQQQLLDIITHYRIFKDSELKALYQRTRDNHPYLDAAEVEDAIATVQAQLDD